MVPTITSATLTAASCSQNRKTVHPRPRSSPSVRRSLATLASSFAAHHSALAAGRVECWGHPCQKQPSTKTTSRRPRHTMSPRARRSFSGRTSTRNRTPRACSSRLIRISALVSRRFCRLIRARTASDEAAGRPGLVATCNRRRIDYCHVFLR